MKKEKCPQCVDETGHINAGFTASGSQRYKCTVCGNTHTPVPKTAGYTEEERTAAIQLYYEGVSARAVGRQKGMSKANVLRWIKERAATLPEPNSQTAENTLE